MDLPDWLPTEIWNEWIDYRREDKKKPATERSQRMTLRKLERFQQQGYCPIKLIEMAIEREWEGIYSHEDCKHEISTRVSTKRPQSAVERVHAANITRINAGRIVDQDDGNLRPQMGVTVR